MKKFVVPFLLLSAFVCGNKSTVAQDSIPNSSTKNIFKLYIPNDIVGNEMNLAFEHVFSKSESMEVVLAYHYKEHYFMNQGGLIPEIWWSNCECKETSPAIGGSIRLSYRHYFNKRKNAPFGGYFSPQLMYKYSIATIDYYGEGDYYDKINIRKNAFTLKMIWGHQLPLFKRFTFDYFGGLGFRTIFKRENTIYRDRWGDGNGEDTNIVDHYFLFSPTLHLGISVGFGF